MVNLQQNVTLSNFSNFKIGGAADYFVQVKNLDEVLETVKIWDEVLKDLNGGHIKIFVLGGGTNLIISDEGFRGLVIQNSISFIDKIPQGLRVGAGTLFPDLVSYCIENSLSGFEWAGGLPGTVGGAIRGNAGAFGGETKDNVIDVESINLKTLEVKKRKAADCRFDYRMSVFKNGDGEGEMITAVSFLANPGQKAEIEEKTNYGVNYRNERHPLEYPNTGSIFKNTPLAEVPQATQEQFSQSVKNDPFPVLPAAKLISAAELKGKQVGGAAVSPKHPNFIVNVDNAKAEDVKELIKIVKDRVNNLYKVHLEEEVISI